MAAPGWLLSRTADADRMVRRPGLPTLELPNPADPVRLLGRSRACDVVLDEPSVSREHAALMLYGGQWFVTERGSTNGTRVNGRRVWGTASIRPGDRVSLGTATYRLVAPR